MKPNSIKSLCLVNALAVLAAGCGGSSSDGPLLNGVFVDSPVAGMGYETPTHSGVTNIDGVYHYREGETVIFSIGNLTLPVVMGAETVTPLDMVDSGAATDPQVINIARLLQSLDEDSDPSNGIIIAAPAPGALSESMAFDGRDDDAVTAIVEQVFAGEREAVTEAAAEAHLIESLSADTGSVESLGQWQYLVAENATFGGDSLYVSQTDFTLTLDGEVHNGGVTVHEGVYYLEGTEQDWFVSVADEDESKLACIAASPTAVASCVDPIFHVFQEEQEAVSFNNETTQAIDPEVGAAIDGEELSSAAPDVDDNEPTEVAEVPEPVEPVTPVEIAAPAEPVEFAAPVEITEPVAPVAVEAPVEPVAPVELPEPVEVPTETVPVEVPSEPVSLPEVGQAPEVDQEPAVDQEPETDQVPVIAAPPIAQASDITDIIVLTGQANAAAVQTESDPVLDLSLIHI